MAIVTQYFLCNKIDKLGAKEEFSVDQLFSLVSILLLMSMTRKAFRKTAFCFKTVEENSSSVLSF